LWRNYKSNGRQVIQARFSELLSNDQTKIRPGEGMAWQKIIAFIWAVHKNLVVEKEGEKEDELLATQCQEKKRRGRRVHSVPFHCGGDEIIWGGI